MLHTIKLVDFKAVKLSGKKLNKPESGSVCMQITYPANHGFVEVGHLAEF